MYGTSGGGRVRRGATGGRGFNLSGMTEQKQVFSPSSQHLDFSVSRGRGNRYLQNPLEGLSHPCRVDVSTPEVDFVKAVLEKKKGTPSTGATAQPTVVTSVSVADGKGPPCISCQQSDQTMATLLKDIGTTLVNFAAKLEKPPQPK